MLPLREWGYFCHFKYPLCVYLKLLIERNLFLVRSKPSLTPSSISERDFKKQLTRFVVFYARQETNRVAFGLILRINTPYSNQIGRRKRTKKVCSYTLIRYLFELLKLSRGFGRGRSPFPYFRGVSAPPSPLPIYYS